MTDARPPLEATLEWDGEQQFTGVVGKHEVSMDGTAAAAADAHAPAGAVARRLHGDRPRPHPDPGTPPGHVADDEVDRLPGGGEPAAVYPHPPRLHDSRGRWRPNTSSARSICRGRNTARSGTPSARTPSSSSVSPSRDSVTRLAGAAIVVLLGLMPVAQAPAPPEEVSRLRPRPWPRCRRQRARSGWPASTSPSRSSATAGASRTSTRRRSRSLLRAGLRRGAGPAVAARPVAAHGGGHAVGGGRPVVRRPRHLRPPAAVSRRHGRRVAHLRPDAGPIVEAFVRGVNAQIAHHRAHPRRCPSSSSSSTAGPSPGRPRWSSAAWPATS